MTTQWLSRIEEYLWPHGERRDVWLIADAARDREIFRMLLECHLNYSCLYSGPLPSALEIAAPYLVQLDYDYRDTRRFIREAWGNNWGVFLRCDASLERLRRHLRGFLVVRDPGGSRLVFRYYDPRILRIYLPTCTKDELDSVFGPIECFWTEGITTENLLEFRFERGKLVQRTLSLTADTAQRLDLESQRDETARVEAHTRPGLLTVRTAQMAAFSQSEVQKFEDWMCSHLRKFFQRQCEALSEPQLRDLIQYGIKRAAGHKITSKRDVCKFIDLMAVFGRDLHTDRRLPWAGEILSGKEEARPKIEALYKAATKYLREP